MTTLQEQFERDFSNRERMIEICRYKNRNFTNYDLDLREYRNLWILNLMGSNLTSINLSGCELLRTLRLENNQLTSADFLNTLPNPEKLTDLCIYNNNIQPTNISIFSKFVNLKTYLKIGTIKSDLEKGKHNKFYGSFKS